ncbi:MAG: beta-propeller fold lactonase family protein [Deltaproteobacteria bacterium]|nr:beta-propeller fold lactonase family protein [Deltaproteobacteria bacterium]
MAPDGRVTSTSNLATPAGRSLAVRTMASGQRAFSLANLSGSGVVSTLDVAADGALTLTSTTPATFAGFPEDIVLDPGGRLLWGLARILGQQVGAVYPFVIDPSGALRPSSPASISTPSATAIAYVPRAELMLLAGADGNVYQYRVDADGLLTALATPSVVVGSPGGYDVVAEPSGRFAYVSSVADNTVSAFEISIDGLTAIGSVDAGGRPDKLVADPSGRSIAVLHGGFPGAAIAHFAIGASGALTFLGVSPAPSVGGNLAMVRGAPLALDAEHVIVQQRLAPLEYRLRRFDIDGQGQLVPGSEADVVNGFGDLGVTSDPSGENVYATAHRASGDGQDLVEFDARAGALAPLTPSVGPLSLVDGWVVFGPRGNLHLERYAATPVDGRLPQTLTTSPDAYGLLTPPVFDPAGRFAWIPDTAGLFGPTPSIDRLPIAEITMSALSFEGEIVVSRDGRFAWGVPFVIGVAELTPMQIDSQTGALTAQTPLTLPGDVRAAAVHPSGRFLFVAGIGEVWSFEIGADGALTSVGTAMSPNAGSFRQLVVSRSGRYLYAMANENNAQTNQFAINSDGTLTPLVPFSIPMWSVDAVASGTWR